MVLSQYMTGTLQLSNFLSYQLLEQLDIIGGLYRSVPKIVLYICLACNGTLSAPEYVDNYLLHYLVTFLGSYGGTHLSAVLLSDRANLQMPILSCPILFPTFTTVWWLMHHCPWRGFYSFCHFKPVQTVTRTISQIARCNNVTSRVALSAKLYPGQVFSGVILGTMGMGGGRIAVGLLRCINGCQEERDKSELAKPGFAFRSSLFSAIFLVAVTHSFLLTSTQGYAILCMLLTGQVLLNNALGLDLDFTRPIFKVLHYVSNIPEPDQALSKEPRRAASVRHRAVLDSGKPTDKKPAGVTNGANAVIDKVQQCDATQGVDQGWEQVGYSDHANQQAQTATVEQKARRRKKKKKV